jgi:enamine deaminase RidA (YjgF/YER057c/UK114 family)
MPKTRTTGARTRRQVLTAGITAVAATAVTSAQEAPAASPPRTPATDWTPRKEAIRMPGPAGSPNPVLSSCIRSGHLLFLAGIGGWYPDRRKEPGDITVQIRSALTTMREILEHAGSSMANVLKVHMTVADPNRNLAALNQAYRGFFPDPPPVRSYSGAGVDQMGREGVLVQIDCVAYVD